MILAILPIWMLIFCSMFSPMSFLRSGLMSWFSAYTLWFCLCWLVLGFSHLWIFHFLGLPYFSGWHPFPWFTSHVVIKWCWSLRMFGFPIYSSSVSLILITVSEDIIIFILSRPDVGNIPWCLQYVYVTV